MSMAVLDTVIQDYCGIYRYRADQIFMRQECVRLVIAKHRNVGPRCSDSKFSADMISFDRKSKTRHLAFDKNLL